MKRYENAKDTGWSEKKKMEEMKELNPKYLVVFEQGRGRPVVSRGWGLI
jgi:hypothetical protein